jgi:hypothetical protein
MAHDAHVYGEVDSVNDLKEVFLEIRRDVEAAHSRPGLTELYKRAGYLITLTHSPSLQKWFGRSVGKVRNTAQKEFAVTARRINHRAKQIGTEADYDENWGKTQ